MSKNTTQPIEIETEVNVQATLRHISWGTVRRLGMLNAQLNAVQKRVNRFTDEGDLDNLNQALEQLDNIMSTIETTICGLIISVPREWLVDEAPDALDWSTREALQYLRAEYFTRLVEIASGAAQREAGKN